MAGVDLYFPPTLERDWERSRDQLQEQLHEISRQLLEIRQTIDFGPVPGAYFTIDLGRSNNSGVSLPTGAVDQFPFDFSLRPIQLTAVCFGGNLTFDVLSQSSSILSAGAVSLVGGTAQTFGARGDFASEGVTGDLTLSVVSIDSGNPSHLRVSITCKNASKIEPA